MVLLALKPLNTSTVLRKLQASTYASLPTIPLPPLPSLYNEAMELFLTSLSLFKETPPCLQAPPCLKAYAHKFSVSSNVPFTTCY